MLTHRGACQVSSFPAFQISGPSRRGENLDLPASATMTGTHPGTGQGRHPGGTEPAGPCNSGLHRDIAPGTPRVAQATPGKCDGIELL